jgi:uncharacterized protein
MAIKFSGEFEVKKKPDEVYDFLTDPNRFAPLLPEFQSLLVQDSTHFAVKVNVGISYIKGSADVKMELAEADRPRRAQYKGQGAVAGGNVTMIAGFDLAPAATAQGQEAVAGGNVTVVAEFDPAPTADGVVEATIFGTKVNWQGEAQVFGRLTSVAGGVLEPLAKKQIKKLIDGLQAALG